LETPFVTAFTAIASALFIAELTDKDAMLILALATRSKAVRVFLAGSVAFTMTTAIIVSLGAILITLVPIAWIKIAGGMVMLGYGAWQARGLLGKKEVEQEERVIERSKDGIRTFLLTVGALALLDLAGDATEVLTIVFVAQYSDLILVFSAACVGLIAATGVETALGNQLGRWLTPTRARYLSASIFVVLGIFILATGLS
jgi:putative Ca2+/H+ antiporter (TMEM165/GDT1 family)